MSEANTGNGALFAVFLLESEVLITKQFVFLAIAPIDHVRKIGPLSKPDGSALEDGSAPKRAGEHSSRRECAQQRKADLIAEHSILIRRLELS